MALLMLIAGTVTPIPVMAAPTIQPAPVIEIATDPYCVSPQAVLPRPVTVNVRFGGTITGNRPVIQSQMIVINDGYTGMIIPGPIGQLRVANVPAMPGGRIVTIGGTIWVGHSPNLATRITIPARNVWVDHTTGTITIA